MKCFDIAGKEKLICIALVLTWPNWDVVGFVFVCKQLSFQVFVLWQRLWKSRSYHPLVAQVLKISYALVWCYIWLKSYFTSRSKKILEIFWRSKHYYLRDKWNYKSNNRARFVPLKCQKNILKPLWNREMGCDIKDW